MQREKQQCLANCSTYQVRANQRVHERDGRYQKENSQGYGFERLDADVCWKEKAQGQSGSNAATIRNTMLHLIIYRGEFVRMSQLDKAYCEGLWFILPTLWPSASTSPNEGSIIRKTCPGNSPTLLQYVRHGIKWSSAWGNHCREPHSPVEERREKSSVRTTAVVHIWV